VLYLDLDADGDLTESRERFVGKSDEDASGGKRRKFEIGAFWPRGAKVPHQDFTITWQAPSYVSFDMRWRGQERIGGGFGKLVDERLEFSPSLRGAPVLVPGCDQPMQFLRRGNEPLRRKHLEELLVLAGNPGSGVASFSCLDARALGEKDTLVATLLYRDGNDRLCSERFEWKNRC
jgi:hypothetical protein